MRVRCSKPFNIYLTGQGISNLGDSFRFIAVTILIFNITGSGLNAAAGLALSSIPGIIASPFAGVLEEKMDERRVLVVIELVRTAIVPLFIIAEQIIYVYMLLVLLALLDIFYMPSKRKYILRTTGRNGAVKANSLLTGVSGAAYLAGPMAAGILTDSRGYQPAIIIAAICCGISAIFTYVSGSLCSEASYTDNIKRTGSGIKPYNTVVSNVNGIRSHNTVGEFISGIKYCYTDINVRPLIFISYILGFCVISINMVFYPFAFDVLKVTARGWSLMITIYYGTNLVAMLIVKKLDKFLKKNEINMNRMLYTGLIITAAIWGIYALTENIAYVLALQFVEGSVIAMCGIILAAKFQLKTEKRFMARVSSINELFANVGKIIGLSASALLIGFSTYRAVFVFCTVVMFLFAAYGIIFTKGHAG